MTPRRGAPSGAPPRAVRISARARVALRSAADARTSAMTPRLLLVLGCVVAGALAAPPRPQSDVEPPPRLGVRYDPSECAPEGGLRIAEVLPASPASAAGLRPDDVLCELDGVAIDADADLVALLAAKPSGASVRLGVRRGAERLVLTARLVGGPASAAPRRESALRTTTLRGSAGTTTSRPDALALAEARLAEAKRLLAAATPDAEDLARARALLEDASAALLRARLADQAPPPRPKAVILRAEELAREGTPLEEIRVRLEAEFGVPIRLNGVVRAEPVEEARAASRPTSRPASRPTSPK